MKKAIVTVIGNDCVGIIATISQCLAQHNVNILDISQTTMQEYFTMIMLVDLAACATSFDTLQQDLDVSGKSLGMQVRIQLEDTFQSMHRIG